MYYPEEYDIKNRLRLYNAIHIFGAWKLLDITLTTRIFRHSRCTDKS